MEDASLQKTDVEAAAPASAATVDTPLSPNELPLEHLWNSLDEPGFAEAVTEGDKHARLQSFLSITAVQQTLVLTLGSLAYDAGSIAYLIDLRPASILFLFASGLFVVGLALDIRELQEQRRNAASQEIAALLRRNMWRRYVALVLNVAGGVLSLWASAFYLRVSLTVSSYQGNESALRIGDILFAVGIWLFSAGTTVLVVDMRATVIAISKLLGKSPPPVKEDKALQVLILYTSSLGIFGIASTLYILPGDTSQTAGVALFVVSNISVTAINLVGIKYLWREHTENWAVQCLTEHTLKTLEKLEAQHEGWARYDGHQYDDEDEEASQPPSSSAATLPQHPARTASGTSTIAALPAKSEDGSSVLGVALAEGEDDMQRRSSDVFDEHGGGTVRIARRHNSLNRSGTPTSPMSHHSSSGEMAAHSEGSMTQSARHGIERQLTRTALNMAGLLPSARMSTSRSSAVPRHLTSRVAHWALTTRISADRSDIGADESGSHTPLPTPPTSVRSDTPTPTFSAGSSAAQPPSAGALRKATSLPHGFRPVAPSAPSTVEATPEEREPSGESDAARDAET